MKTAACIALRRKLASKQPTFGLWITLESPSVTEMAVALGLDWVVIDAEHGHLDWKEIVEHLRATVRSETVALVRIAELNGGLIKRALDIGADGVIIPWVESAEQLTQAVQFARYPLEGLRGIGAERATAWGQCFPEHAAEANDHVFVVPIIETVRTTPNVPMMIDVPGVDLYFFGPADYSSSAGYRGQWEGPGVADDILRMKDIICEAGKHCGIVGISDENVRLRVEQGFGAVALGMDSGLLIRSLKTSLANVGRDRPMRADLSVPVDVPPVVKKPAPFVVALTGDFQDGTGQLRYREIGLDRFDDSPMSLMWFAEHRAEITPEQIADANGVIVLTPRVTAGSLRNASQLLAIGRFGVGYDSVDVAACTEADVMLFIAAGAVDRSVAEATIGWMIALSHHMRIKDRLVREVRWDERSHFMGTELRDRTLGVIGYGGIGRALVKLLASFGMKQPLVFDPFVKSATGVKLVHLDELLAQSDFVSIHCPLTESTRNLIGDHELKLMKPMAYLINTARGGIINEDALELALRERRIAGAALDCFEVEPLTTPSRFTEFDNVLLAPHSIAWTHELFRDIGRSVCQGMLDLACGRVPAGVVNPEVLERPGFQAKWKRLLTQPE